MDPVEFRFSDPIPSDIGIENILNDVFIPIWLATVFDFGLKYSESILRPNDGSVKIMM